MKQIFMLESPKPAKTVTYNCGGCPHLRRDSGLHVNFNRCAAWQVQLAATLYSATPEPHKDCLDYLQQKDS